MQPVLRRIALHGALTALVLGVVGFMFAELASIWLAASPGTRAATGGPIESPDSDGAIAAALRRRVPLLMAAWGFGFVAVGELVLYLWRGGKKPKPPPPPDETERLLAELRRQADPLETNPDEVVASSAIAPDNTPVRPPLNHPASGGPSAPRVVIPEL